jgi:hypothetical protein
VNVVELPSTIAPAYDPEPSVPVSETVSPPPEFEIVVVPL